MTTYAVIRIRGTAKKNFAHVDTMEMLRLFKPNHLVLVDERAQGMLLKIQDFITWGEISQDVLEQLVEKRGRTAGDRKVTAAFLKEHKIASMEELAGQVLKNPKHLQTLGIKPVFRLNPPSKGYERAGIKRTFNVGGALGYRAEKINKLIGRMM